MGLLENRSCNFVRLPDVPGVNGKHQPLFAGDFVLHSLRHTMLTRLGESGVDASTIMRIAGHSSIIVSQRFVDPIPEAVERAFERMQLPALPEIEPKRPSVGS
jgi:integrase